MYTFANRKLIFGASRMADDVVKLVGWSGHTSRGSNIWGILDGITWWRREDTAYVLSAPAET